MLLRRTAVLLLLTVLCCWAAPTRATGSADWRVWLVSGRHLLVVGSDGITQAERDLPLPTGYDSISCLWPGIAASKISISPDHKLLAYSAVNQFAQTWTIVIYNWSADQIVQHFDYEALAVAPCGGSRFDELGNNFAFSYQTKEAGWQVAVLNILSGKRVYLLDSGQLPQVPPQMKNGSTPYIQLYQANQVKFTLYNLAGAHEPQGFVWDLPTDTLYNDIAYPLVETNTLLPTGEVVSGDADCDSLSAPLEVYDPIAKARFTFANLERPAKCVPLIPRFVQNGERILVTTGAGNLWSLLERDGTLVDTWQMPSNNLHSEDITGTPDGFIYTMYYNPPSSEGQYPLPAVFAVNTRGNQLGNGEAVWNMRVADFKNLPNGDGELQVVAVESNQPLGPFKPWAQLNDPVYQTGLPATPTIQPTVIPTPEPLYHVGMTVRVQTTGGEILNLRESPTREAEVIMYLTNKMELTLLEGPLQAEGYTWWQVRTADGIEGWAVDFNGELQTLMPIINP